jgi:hypothetical protein
MSERRRLELSATQLVAGGLATSTAAVVSSYLGVAGTIIGAGVMSIVTTVGGAVYQHYLDRGKERYATLTVLREGRAAAPADSPGETAGEPEKTTADQPAETAAEGNGTEGDKAGADGKGIAAAERPLQRVRWYVVAGTAVAIFAVVMGGITLVESVTNRPISAMVGDPGERGTSLGQTFGDGGSEPANRPVTPTTSPSVSPGESTAPGPAPTSGGPVPPPASLAPTSPPTTTAPPTQPPTLAPPPPTGGATP